MLLNAYQEQAMDTAIYPSNATVFYTTLGLAGELGELVEKIYLGLQQGIVKEAGDMLWYIANLAADLDATLPEMLTFIGCPATNFEQLEVWVLENRASPRISSPTALLSVKVGEVCDSVKKMYRDDNGELTVKRRTHIVSLLAWVLFGLSSQMSTLDLRLTPIAELNIKKLANRKQRGVIQGNGDSR